MSIGSFPETSSQAILVGIILVGRLGCALRVPAIVDRSRLYCIMSYCGHHITNMRVCIYIYMYTYIYIYIFITMYYI